MTKAPFLKPASKRYWTLQAFGWTAFLFVNLAITAGFTGIETISVVGYINVSVVGLFTSHGIRGFIIRGDWAQRSAFIIARNIVLAAVFGAALWALVSLSINNQFYTKIAGYKGLPLVLALTITFQFMVMLLVWQGIYLVTILLRNSKQAEQDKWNLVVAAKDAQLMALKAQINPHFLFNALNSIRALVLEQPEVSREMISRLSAMFRYNLSFAGEKSVPLAEEIKVTGHYLALEKVRFEHRLLVTWTLVGDLDDFLIPPLTLQTLVENAVNHGIANLPAGGEVAITIASDPGRVCITVRNQGQLKSDNGASSSSGLAIGLKNTQERLRIFYGDRAKVSLEQVGVYVEATMILPKADHET